MAAISQMMFSGDILCMKSFVFSLKFVPEGLIDNSPALD